MRSLLFLTAAIVLLGSGCTKSSTEEALSSASGPPSQSAVAPVAAASALDSPYRLLGILDPDRDRMVAFALKIPREWRAQQDFQRQWDGAVGLPQISITLNAPDGRSQITYLPSTQYIYSEGPMSNNLRAQKRAMGMPEQSTPHELAPMPPVAYLKNVFLRTLAQNGVTLRELGHEQVAPDVRRENGSVESRGSLDGILPNGSRARLECRISYSSRQMGSDLYHSWNVVPSITQTADDLEAIHAFTRVAQDSIVMNPTWLRLEQDAQNRGFQANSEASRQQHEATMNQIQANTAAMTRAHNQRMSAIQQFGEANTARFNQRMADMDRDQRIRVDTIRGESQYVNPTTGERTKVEDGHNHVYTSKQNPEFFLGTDTPIDAGTLDWQELQKVQLKDY